MRAFVFLVALLVVGVAGLGFYLGWVHFSSDSAADKPSVTITVDKDKIHADEKTAKDKMHSIGHEANEKIHESTGKPMEPQRQP
jgi:hypothetical protein